MNQLSLLISFVIGALAGLSLMSYIISHQLKKALSQDPFGTVKYTPPIRGIPSTVIGAEVEGSKKAEIIRVDSNPIEDFLKDGE